MEHSGIHLGPGGGALADLGGSACTSRVRGEQTGGAFAIVEHPVSPAVIVEPHVHRHEDELSIVLDGIIWAARRPARLS